MPIKTRPTATRFHRFRRRNGGPKAGVSCPIAWWRTSMKIRLATIAVALLAAGAATAAPREQGRTGNLQPPLRMAAAAPMPSLTAMVPLNQVENVPERVATARVTDADGTVIGAVQKVKIENGNPTRLDIVLLGSENTIALDAASVRYDAASNVVATSE